MHVRRAGATAIVLGSLVAVAVPSAGAADADDPRAKKRQVDAQVRALDARLDATAARVKDATEALERAESKLPLARAALAEATAGARDAQAAATAAAEQIAHTRAEMWHTARRQDALATELIGRRKALAALARQAYTGGDFSRLGIAFGAQTPEQLTSAMTYLQTVNRSQRNALDGLADAERALEAQRAYLVELGRRDEAERRAATEAVARANQAVVAAADAQRTVTSLVSERTDALAEARKLKAVVERKLAEQEAESRRLAKIIAARIAAARRAAGNLPANLGGVLSLPVIGPITSGYGMRYHPILRRNKLHTGTDFGVPTGTPVRAAADGEVLQVIWSGAYGRRVVVDHGRIGGAYIVTTYNHMSRFAVRKGQRLTRGQILGYVGSTGWSTGPHLHFEVLANGKFIDPMRMLRGR